MSDLLLSIYIPQKRPPSRNHPIIENSAVTDALRADDRENQIRVRSKSTNTEAPVWGIRFWRFKSLPQNWSLWMWTQLISSCCSRTDCDTLVSSGCYRSSFHLHVVMMMATKFHPFVAGVFMMRSVTAENGSHLMASWTLLIQGWFLRRLEFEFSFWLPRKWENESTII